MEKLFLGDIHLLRQPGDSSVGEVSAQIKMSLVRSVRTKNRETTE